MPQALLTTPNFANIRGAKTCTVQPESRTPSRIQVAITDLLRARYPRKTWAFLASMFDIKERAAKHRLANQVSYTVEELQVLLKGEDGFEYFEALMEDAAPQWWLWTKHAFLQGEKRRVIAEAEQEYLELERHLPPTAIASRLKRGNADATRKLQKTFAKKETALGFLRPELDRASHSPVVPALAKGRSR